MYIRKYLIVVFAVVIVGAIGLDIVLLRQIGDLEAEYEFRGAYTFPGFGAFFLSENPDGSPERAPLTLVIFFSAQTERGRVVPAAAARFQRARTTDSGRHNEGRLSGRLSFSQA